MNRSTFLKTLGLFSAGMTGLHTFAEEFENLNYSDTLPPVLFIGHGSPMNAIEDNTFTQRLARLGAEIEKPVAVLVVSAHWLTRGTFVTGNPQPRIIYDFGGFPQELYEVKYEAPGAPGLAQAAKETVTYTPVEISHEWGLDHGAWSILRHIFPKADVPVFQLSLDYRKDTAFHYDLGTYLKALRKKGVLIIGSGNIVHNLRNISWDTNAKPFDWAMEFDEKIRANIVDRNFTEIVNYEKWGNLARLAHPSNDHFLPLLYTLSLREKNDEISFIYEGIQNGSISMRAVRIG